MLDAFQTDFKVVNQTLFLLRSLFVAWGPTPACATYAEVPLQEARRQAQPYERSRQSRPFRLRDARSCR